MDKEKNWEEENNENDYTGYSEKQTDLDIEMKAGEWHNLSRFKVYRQRSRQGKIIATHQAVSNRLSQLEQLFYKLARNNPEKSVKMLAEIKKLRLMQDVLLQCIAWCSEADSRSVGERTLQSHRGEIPQEVWDLIG